jgi:hypothetical protein
MGRFMSPDWSAKEEPVPYATMDDPQSLNLYSYVRNNPLTRVDADGHCCDITMDDVKGGVGIVVGIIAAPEEAAAAGAGIVIGLGLGAGAYDVAHGYSPSATPGGYPTTFNLNPTSENASASSSASSGQQSTAAQPSSSGNLAKSPTGPGSVPPDQRDPKRTATKSEKTQKLGEQGGKCAHCDKPVKDGDARAHHYPDRHADGGKDTVIVCKDCHKDLHSGSN